jgi:hypothetical protein
LKGPVTPAKIKGVYQTSVPRKPGLVMAITTRVVTLKASLAERVTTEEENIGYKKSDCWQLDDNKNKRPKIGMVGGDSGKDCDGPEFLLCALSYDQEEGSTVTDYTVHVIEYVEEETFDFVTEDKEEESKGGDKSI